VWPFVASTLLNIIAWVTLYPSLFFSPETHASAVVASSVRLEHLRVPLPHPQRGAPAHRRISPKLSPPPIAIKSRSAQAPHRKPKPHATADSDTLIPASNQVARLKLPPAWATLDMGEATAEDSAIWLDFKKARGAFVPRILIMELKTMYLSGPSLQDAVHDIVDGLRAQGAKMHASNAQPVCGAKRLGWFLSYNKPDDDPPWDFDEVLVLQGDTVYRITYSRPDGTPEDAKTRAALKTLCPLRRS
jgi:hypothetical protein